MARASNSVAANAWRAVCRGESLCAVAVEVRDGGVYLADS